MHIKNDHKYQRLPVFLLIVLFFFLNFTCWFFLESSNYTAQLSQYPNYPEPAKQLISFPSFVSASKNDDGLLSLQLENIIQDKRATFSLPVLSLSGSKNVFFGPTGLYSVKSNHPKYQSIQPKIHIKLLDSSGRHVYSSDARARVAGVSTKKLPLKSLNLHLQQELNSELIFSDQQSYLLESLRLRNAGNDFLLAYMRDNVVRELAKDLHLISLQYQPVVVQINGEFWGVQYLRERVNKNFLFAKYPELDREHIVLGELKKRDIFALSKGFSYKLGDLTQLIKEEDLNQPEFREKLEEKLNIDSFIDYIIIQTFISNTDWPHNNVKCAFINGQLNFVLYDTDFSLGYVREYFKHTDDFFTLPDRYYQVDEVRHPFLDNLDFYVPTYVGQMHSSLMQYNFYRSRFLERYHDLLLTDLSQTQVKKAVKKISNQISPIMPAHIARWGTPSSVEAWEYHTGQILKFCKERRAFIREKLDSVSLKFSTRIPQGISSEESP